MIYLDNAATTFPKPERVYDALEVANRELSFNAGRGSYKAARDASAVIDDTKKRLCNPCAESGSQWTGSDQKFRYLCFALRAQRSCPYSLSVVSTFRSKC